MRHQTTSIFSSLRSAIVSTLVIFLIFAISISADEISSAQYKTGDEIERFELEDQHGETHVLDEEVRIVLFAPDMPAGDLLKGALTDLDVEYLREKSAIYVADIHRMPGMAAKMFAIPKMRKRPYPMWLDHDGEITARFPAEEEKVTLMRLESLRITDILSLDSAQAVQHSLEDSPGR